MTDKEKILDNFLQEEYGEFRICCFLFDEGLEKRKTTKFNSSDFYKFCKSKCLEINDFYNLKPRLKRFWIEKIKDGTIPKDQLVRTKI